MLKQRESLKTYFKNKQTDRQKQNLFLYMCMMYMGVVYTTVRVCVCVWYV